MADSKTFSAPVDFRLPENPPEGIADPVASSAFVDVYNTISVIQQTFVDNCGIGSQPKGLYEQLEGTVFTVLAANMGRFYVRASEDISFGAMISLHNGGSGISKARNANATNNTRPCHGYSNSPDTLAGEMIEAILGRGTLSITGLSPGADYFLSTTDGLVAGTPAVAAGNIEQYLGVALTSGVLLFNSHYWIQH